MKFDIPAESKVIFYRRDLAICLPQTIEETLSHCHEQSLVRLTTSTHTQFETDKEWQRIASAAYGQPSVLPNGQEKKKGRDQNGTG